MPDLSTERVPLATLKPHPDNPRNGDVEAIAESLHTNGQYKPIVVAKDGTVLAGNHTYAAALSLGWEDIQVVRLGITAKSKAAKRIMLADNRTSDMGRYDEAQLLRELQALNGDLLGTGYSERDLEALEHLWDDPLNLDDLIDIHGEPTADDGLVMVRARVTDQTEKAWKQWREQHDDDDSALASLLSP